MAPPVRFALAALTLITAPAHVAAQHPLRPAAESKAAQLTVPPVPSFELPPGEPGVRTARELRIVGRDWLGTEITVRGYITWIYDCEREVTRPGETPEQVKKRIYDDQTLCERPKFYFSDAKDTPPDRSIWVVDVPRPPTRVERDRLPKATLAQWPAVPKFALGDYVTITGTWALQSPHGDRNSDGLLVFKSMQPARPAPPPSPPARATTARPVPAAPAAAPKVPPTPPPVRIDPVKRDLAIRQSNAGAMSLRRNDFDTAIREYGAAVAMWPEHDAAWYYLAYAYVRKQDYRAAVAAAANAPRLAPDVAMYRLMYGLSLYEAERQRAREAQAAAQGQKPEEVVPDTRSQNHDAALAQLLLAVHLDGDVWRAHYYCGRIYRDRDDAGRAAASFSEAVRRAPLMAAPYVALADLYRRWDYFDQAIEVSRLGATTLTAPVERGDVLYMLALALEDKREHGAAIGAYTQALEARPDLADALVQRGRIYWSMKKPAAAKADLEAYLAHPAANGWGKETAQRILLDLASKKH
ncbi:MAG TPA: tetratricopeptide repeat protein [Kofleriaceae bacterium]|nr:tetratricopeptide repeat protein [Kofleriaceae bacterium]